MGYYAKHPFVDFADRVDTTVDYGSKNHSTNEVYMREAAHEELLLFLYYLLKV